MINSKVSFREAIKFWLKLGFIGFGGTAGQISDAKKGVMYGLLQILIFINISIH